MGCNDLRRLATIVQSTVPRRELETDYDFLNRVLDDFMWCLDISKNNIAAMTNAPLLLSLLDNSDNFQAVAGAPEYLFGYTPAELLGKHYSVLLSDLHVNQLSTKIFEKIANRTNVSFAATIETKLLVDVDSFWYLEWSAKDNTFICAIQKLLSPNVIIEDITM